MTKSRACLESVEEMEVRYRGSQVQLGVLRAEAELTFSSEEGNGGTLGTSTTSTTNTVNIVLRVVGIVIVQDMSDVAHIFSNTIKVSKQSH